MNEFITCALAAGFTQKQAEFMDEWLAGAEHEHEIEDVNGLAESLGDEGEDEED